MTSPPIGRHVDRYVIEAELGTGGFGAVYRARHAIVGRPVALKLLHLERSTSPQTVERFLREAKASTAAGSPHIVQILDAGIAAGQPFLAMELLEGEDLGARVARTGQPSTEDTLAIAAQMLEGLGAAHAAGIVHRDLKPANIFLCEGPDGRDFVKLLDFGVSKIGGGVGIESLTRTGMVLGTPYYMAPEQFRGARDVDARADLYSAAVVAYELLSGRLPYDALSYESLIVKMHTGRPVPLGSVAPHLPAPLAAAVDRGLARDPDGRWQTAAEMADALAQATVRVSATTTHSPRRAAPGPEPLVSWPVATPQPPVTPTPFPQTARGEQPSLPATDALAPGPVRAEAATPRARGRAKGLFVFGLLAVAGAGLAAGSVVLVLSAFGGRRGTQASATEPGAATAPPADDAPRGMPLAASPPAPDPPKPGIDPVAPVMEEPIVTEAPERPRTPRGRRPADTGMAPPPAAATGMTEPPAAPPPRVAPPDPAPRYGGLRRVTFQISSLGRRIRQESLEAMMRQALGRMTVCRPSGAEEEEVRLQGLVDPTGRIMSVSPEPGVPRGTSFECVARAIRAVDRVEDPGSSGIFRATVVLPPR